MSYIPAKKMPHITAHSGEFDPETGKIVHLHHEPAPEAIVATAKSYGWLAGAVSAGLVAVAVGAFFTLRSSKPKKQVRRRTRSTAKKTATPRRRTTTVRRKTAA